ncbi:MAG: hypothetical protein JW753_09785 [Dehalococcoidia bacterium]|nr:hypothetical protein [Dehalococcoidia bacterium]
MKWDDGYQGEHWFLWSAAAEGYKVVDSKEYRLCDSRLEGKPEAAPPWLVARSSAEKYYRPLEESNLHSHFADLKDEQDIVAFADKYGLLGVDVALAPVGGGERIFGEPLRRWYDEIEALARSLQIWDWVQSEDAGKLGLLFKWSVEGDRLTLRYKGVTDAARAGERASSVTLASRHINPQLLELVRQGELFRPAKYYVCREINARLKQSVYPQLLPFSKDIRDVHLFPKNLLTAMWVMLSQELLGQTRKQRCPICQTRFEVTGARSKYCSQKCRQKAWESNHPDYMKEKGKRKGGKQ